MDELRKNAKERQAACSCSKKFSEKGVAGNREVLFDYKERKKTTEW